MLGIFIFIPQSFGIPGFFRWSYRDPHSHTLSPLMPYGGTAEMSGDICLVFEAFGNLLGGQMQAQKTNTKINRHLPTKGLQKHKDI